MIFDHSVVSETTLGAFKGPHTTYSAIHHPIHHRTNRFPFISWCSNERRPTHRAIDIFTALLVLLLYPLLQEVDTELEAEVLLLQVIQVL